MAEAGAECARKVLWVLTVQGVYDTLRDIRFQEIRAFLAALTAEEKCYAMSLIKLDATDGKEAARRRSAAGQTTFWYDSELLVRTANALAAWPKTAVMTPSEIAEFGESELRKVPGIGRVAIDGIHGIRDALKRMWNLDLAP